MRAPKDRHQQFEIGARGCFIERNADRVWPKRAQIACRFLRVLEQRRARFDFDPNRIEKVFVRDFQSERFQTVGELSRAVMHALSNRLQTARAVINRVHRRDDGEQNLRGANVTRRFVAADVLLACLQREPISGPAFSIVGNADEPAGHVAFVLIPRCKKRGVRSAEAERNAETLRASNRDVGAKFSGRFQ